MINCGIGTDGQGKPSVALTIAATQPATVLALDPANARRLALLLMQAAEVIEKGGVQVAPAAPAKAPRRAKSSKPARRRLKSAK
jgi:hypothetical protein